jgi:hypothetical protein
MFLVFLGVKILKFFDEDPGWRQFGSGMEKSRIRDKHPGSATLPETEPEQRLFQSRNRNRNRKIILIVLKHC